MDFNSLAQEIHETSVSHGLLDCECDAREKIACIHMAFSRALAEYMAGRPMVWHRCNADPNEGPCENKMYCYERAISRCDEGCGLYDREPRGVAVALTDAVILMLDFMAHYEIGYIPKSQRYAATESSGPLPVFVCELHSSLSKVYGFNDGRLGISRNNGTVCNKSGIGWAFSNMIDDIFTWLFLQGEDPEAVLMAKAAYNKDNQA